VGWHWWLCKKTNCDVWQLECHARNVTASVQSDHLLRIYMLPVFFATDQLHGTPHCAEIQPMSQQTIGATRLYHGPELDTHAPPIAFPRCSNRAMQTIGSTKQQ